MDGTSENVNGLYYLDVNYKSLRNKPIYTLQLLDKPDSFKSYLTH